MGNQHRWKSHGNSRNGDRRNKGEADACDGVVRSTFEESLSERSTIELCEEDPTEELSERRMLEIQPMSTTVMGNRHITKIIQVFKPTLKFSIHSKVQELEIGVLEHRLTLSPGRGKMAEMLEKIG